MSMSGPPSGLLLTLIGNRMPWPCLLNRPDFVSASMGELVLCCLCRLFRASFILNASMVQWASPTCAILDWLWIFFLQSIIPWWPYCGGYILHLDILLRSCLIADMGNGANRIGGLPLLPPKLRVMFWPLPSMVGSLPA